MTANQRPGPSSEEAAEQTMVLLIVALVLLAPATGLVGVLAAVFPARRAARMGVLRAITTE